MSSLTENFGISVQIKANNAGQFVMMDDKSNLRGPMYWPAPDLDRGYENIEKKLKKVGAKIRRVN
jgi:hypothetical protein